MSKLIDGDIASLDAPRTAILSPIMYHVTCSCGEFLTAPDTLMGRTGWVLSELIPGNVHVCPRGHYVTIPEMGDTP